MTTIGGMAFLSNILNVNEIYDYVYDPEKHTPNSLEVLNGGLDADNYSGGIGSIPAWACQIGSFAYGYYQGFERWEFQYARQMTPESRDDADSSKRIIHAGLTTRAFLPWSASLVMYGYQAFFKQDATDYTVSAGTGGDSEYYDLRMVFDGDVNQSLYTVLPRGRADTGSHSSPNNDGGMHREPWWRYVTKHGMKQNVSKGYRNFEVSVWSTVYPLGNSGGYDSKLITPTGAVWMLAIR